MNWNFGISFDEILFSLNYLALERAWGPRSTDIIGTAYLCLPVVSQLKNNEKGWVNDGYIVANGN